MWVNKIIKLHDSGKINSCKVDFPLDVHYSNSVDLSIQTLATRGVEELHIKLYVFNVSSKRYYELDEFPYWLLPMGQKEFLLEAFKS